MRPTGHGRLRQHKHRTTESDSFWEDVGHADVATGRGVFSLRAFIKRAPSAILIGVDAEWLMKIPCCK